MKCAIYIRVSTNKEDQKISLENQRSLFYDYVGQREWEIYDFYIDVESGTSGQRKNLKRMIRDAEERKFDIIMAKELSRLARNSELSHSIKRMADENNIEIITLDNAINTLNGNRQLFGLYAWLYEQESQRTSERIKVALRSGAMKGKFKGSIPPYGYRVENRNLIIREDDTPHTIKRIFREYLKGHGTDSIARGLYNDNIPTPSQIAGKQSPNHLWHGSTIKLILNNPHYTGDLVQCRETTKDVTVKGRKKVPSKDQIIIKDCHEPIISRADFEAVQSQMKVRKKNFTAPKKHLFTNVAVCADCGTGMWYRQNRKGYICGGYGRHGTKRCSHHAIKEIDLKLLIINDLQQLSREVNSEGMIINLKEKASKVEKQVRTNLSRLEKETKQLGERKSKFLNLLADGIINKTDYQQAIEKTNKELLKLTSKKVELQKSLVGKEIHNDINKLKAELDTFLLFNELTEEVIHRFINRIEIKKDGTPKIFYRFSAPIQYLTFSQN